MVLRNKWIKIIGCSVFILFIARLKISLIWGSGNLFFSGASMIAPLFGAFFGIGGLGAILLLKKVSASALFSTPFFAFTGLPLLFEAMCWSVDYRYSQRTFARFFLNFLLPLGAFLLFIFHPSVGYGFWFGLYWTIPMGIYLAETAGLVSVSVVTTAIRSTFIAHAVGSVLWCYTVPMTPGQWLALVPLVAIERFVFAGSMVLGHSVLMHVVRHPIFQNVLAPVKVVKAVK